MTEEELKVLETVAARVARRYANKYGVEFDELRGEALAVMVRAHKKFDPGRGKKLLHYLNASATRAISRYAIHLRSPVSGANNSRHSEGLLKTRKVSNNAGGGANRETVTSPMEDSRSASSANGAGARPVMYQYVDSDVIAERILLSERVQKRLEEILSTEEKRLIIEQKVLESDIRYVEVRYGLSKRQLLTILQRARRKIAKDETLWRLWRETCRG